MQTHVISTGTAATTAARPARTSATQRVLIVNGSGDVLEVLEPVLDAGNYDVVFVESSAHAYSLIKRVQPDLVILCLEMDDADGLRVLSMLKLDAETRDIPVVTYTTTGEEPREEAHDEPEPPMFSSRSALLMN
ncbi:MAG TPA: response regulator [Vicinamibacterales bacterium]|nr:response regulator [Vicinamibacterales bacterium]